MQEYKTPDGFYAPPISGGANVRWICIFCKEQYTSIEGSKFVPVMENGLRVKRRKCAKCLKKDTNEKATNKNS